MKYNTKKLAKKRCAHLHDNVALLFLGCLENEKVVVPCSLIR